MYSVATEQLVSAIGHSTADAQQRRESTNVHSD